MRKEKRGRGVPNVAVNWCLGLKNFLVYRVYIWGLSFGDGKINRRLD